MSTECHLCFGLNPPFKRLVDTFLWSHEDLLLKGAVNSNVTYRDLGSRVFVTVDAVLNSLEQGLGQKEQEFSFLGRKKLLNFFSYIVTFPSSPKSCVDCKK